MELVILIPYCEFANLRLTQFLTEHSRLQSAVQLLKHWEFMGGMWAGEAISFSEFLMHELLPNELGSLSLEFATLPPQVSEAVMHALHLPLKAGMSENEVQACLGTPVKTLSFVPGRFTYEFTVGTECPYYVSCTVSASQGLTYVVVIRNDILALCNENA